MPNVSEVRKALVGAVGAFASVYAAMGGAPADILSLFSEDSLTRLASAMTAAGLVYGVIWGVPNDGPK